ncbi:MAG: DUF2892 domain-containing protein [Methylococcales bacterium]|nr:DUF2892 domain-containing protein [Methylococcales bacterium]MCK5924276.1 DUF2892 domain-containing protein [Methylococcales bacterium]
MKFDYKRLIKFEVNVNDKEKQLRLIAGAISILISLFLANILLLLIGLVLVTTGYIRWCPAYSAFNRPLCATETPPAEATPETTTEEKSAETK